MSELTIGTWSKLIIIIVSVNAKKDAATTFLKWEATIVKLEFPSQKESNYKTSMLEFLSLVNMLSASKQPGKSGTKLPVNCCISARMALL